MSDWGKIFIGAWVGAAAMLLIMNWQLVLAILFLTGFAPCHVVTLISVALVGLYFAKRKEQKE